MCLAIIQVCNYGFIQVDKRPGDINTELNSTIDDSESAGNILWTPKEFKFSNMFSYGEDNLIRFDKAQGIMGIFACLGHILLIYSLKYADASKLAPFGYFEIVTNIILGYYVFKDFPDIWTFVGLLIIVSSGVFIFRNEVLLFKNYK